MASNFANDTDVSALMQAAPNEREEIPEELNETPTQDETSEEEVVEGDAGSEQATEGVEAGKPEPVTAPVGPSPAMLEVAKQWLPQQFVTTARDDEQLQQWIDVVREQKQGTTSSEPEPEFEISLPNEEFDDNDAVRKQFKAMNSHHTKVNSGLKKDISDLMSVVTDLQKGHEETVQFRHKQEQNSFDNALDAMDSDYFGSGGNYSEEQFLLRKAIYERAVSVRGKTGESLSQLAESTAKKMLPGLQDKQTKQTYKNRIIEQSNGRLGSGNSKRLPEPEKTADERFDYFLNNDLPSMRHKK